MATFDPNRVTGGTIQLVKNEDGTYSSQVVGFSNLNELSLPDFTTTTSTATDTSTSVSDAVTAATTNTLGTQTTTSFNLPTDSGGSNITDYSGSMTKQAEQTSRLLNKTFNEPLEIKSPTNIFYEDFSETPKTTTYTEPTVSVTDTGFETSNLINEAKVTEDENTITLDKSKLTGAARRKANRETVASREFVPPTSRGPDPLGAFNYRQRPVGTFEDDAGMITPSYDFDEAVVYPNLADSLGITVPERSKDFKSQTAAEKSLGITTERPSPAFALQPKYYEYEQPIKPSATKTFLTSASKVLENIIPGSTILKTALGPMTPVQKHAQKYFNVRDDGRIAGNPSTDLYAGMNRVSAFGNLEEAGAKRIATRENTIAKKGYGPGDKFYDDTQKMKDQQKNYIDSKSQTVSDSSDSNERAALSDPSRSVTYGSQGPVRTDIDVADGGSETSGGGKIVCTMMNESYGFGSFRNKIWMKFHKNLKPEYQKGYHKIFLPLVNYAKQQGTINKIIKKVLEHIAVHSTIDMRETLRGKTHLLGRLYRKIILPLCYWAGKK